MVGIPAISCRSAGPAGKGLVLGEKKRLEDGPGWKKSRGADVLVGPISGGELLEIKID